jgi:hypothetical protein
MFYWDPRRTIRGTAIPPSWGCGYRGLIDQHQLHLSNSVQVGSRDVGRNVEVFLDIRVEGKPTPVTVKLSYEQASDLAALLEPFRKR